MIQNEQNKVAQLTSIASKLVQVQNIINGLSHGFKADDWQWSKLCDISNDIDKYLDDVAKMIGHETIDHLSD